ncbi:glycosyltransferase family 61 protein [Pseudomonas corrugata]|jgi:capsular polysaccharide biosynthesis protein|uniref:glycosyltransferase family 61 protein n=1 Tax=Pseudomonas corrugata TaxID=47879 RepID=UPI0018E62992|nr:glycosyltransferase 61 family protein [Pseudomonas corrugata]MBI6621839.1 glycosyltransferase family 61 protein [Pseudomonas corrugata]MBI6695853.1 glycosyltransferase family 61 protein [Pseudomonas corrugata]
MDELSNDELKKRLVSLEEKVEKHQEQLRSLSILLNAQGRIFEVSNWTPTPSVTEEKTETVGATFQRVEFNAEKSHNKVERLRNTPVGQFYLKYLKKNTLIRWVVLWLWRNGYPIYANAHAHLSGNNKHRWRELTSHKCYVAERNLRSRVLIPEDRVETPAPRVFPTEERKYLISPHASYVYPEIYVFSASNAIAHGGSNFVLIEDKILHHDLYDFARDYTSEELHGRLVFDRTLSKGRWLSHDTGPEVIPVAASFLDSCAPNYAHWMTEVLPRVATFCAIDDYSDIPILINDGLHRNLMESLRVITGYDRKIIVLPTGKAAVVAKLYITSVAGYVPFERRNALLDGHSHGMFSPSAFDLLKLSTESQAVQSEGNWPEKIILRRRTGARLVSNFAELELALVPKGFKVVETERLTFIEQFLLFSRAKIIIGSSGAALANLMFAPKDAKIFILISKFPDTSYWYWQNIACSSGKQISYVLGEADSTGKGIHADFSIDLKNFLSVLEADISA